MLRPRTAQRKYSASTRGGTCTPAACSRCAAMRSDAPVGTDTSTSSAASASGCCPHHIAPPSASSAADKVASKKTRNFHSIRTGVFSRKKDL